MCPCFHPITAYQDIDSDKIYFYKPSDNLVNYKVLKLPCGKCIGCRKSRSTDWAVRCFHESKLHKQNCFLTLTFDDKKIKEYKQTHPLDNSVSEFMPVDLAYSKVYFQKFMKRLRKKFPFTTVRFFHCGEYGSKNGRAHHHVILFGCDFSDKRQVAMSKSGHVQYMSDVLSDLWKLGRCTVQDVNYRTSLYVAKYTYKSFCDFDIPDYISPPYITFSNRISIGFPYFYKYKDEFFRLGFCRDEDTNKHPIPKNYRHKMKTNHYNDNLLFMYEQLLSESVESLSVSDSRLLDLEKVALYNFTKNNDRNL